MYNACSIIEAELSIPSGTFFNKVTEDAEHVKSALKTSELFRCKATLGKDVYQIGSTAPILTKGSDLWENIDSLLRRIERGAELKGPLEIEANDEIDRYLKTKISRHIDILKNNIINRPEFSAIYRNTSNEELKEILEGLGEIVDHFLSRPEIVTAFLSNLTDERNRTLIEDSMNAACLSMILFQKRKGFYEHSQDKRTILVNVGAAALFRDISIIIYPSQYSHDDIPAHTLKSVEIMESLQMNADVSFAVLHHHNLNTDRKGLKPPSSLAQLYKDVVVLVDLFIDLTSRKKFGENEVVISLTQLARTGCLDEHLVAALGEIFVGKDKKDLIEDGLQLITSGCDIPEKKAYLWNPKSPVPYAIICANLECKECGKLFVETFKDIESNLELGIVPKGGYRHCRKLTRKLLDLDAHVIGEELALEISKRLHLT